MIQKDHFHGTIILIAKYSIPFTGSFSKSLFHTVGYAIDVFPQLRVNLGSGAN